MDGDPRARARSYLAEADRKLAHLARLDPYLIDLSLRENPVGARVGQTLAEKLEILELVRRFGFENVLFGTLDYALSDEPEVDDDFMIYLRDHGIDMTGGFAFTDLGRIDPGGAFRPSPSMEKLAAYRVPNTLHEISLTAAGMQDRYDLPALLRTLPASIGWLLANVRGDRGGRPRILVNIVDGCDAFTTSFDAVCDVLELLATLPIEGVSFEDDRGTYLPVQVGAFVAAARSLLPPPLKLLVHLHAGGGFENAALLEALLAGADGAWGGLPKRAAMIGHASLGELLANLARLGNPHLARYQLGTLLPLATRLQVTDERAPVPDDLPILGANAYRVTLSAFRQVEGRAMDLPSERIGGRDGYRVCPVVSDPPVLAGRLAEITGRHANEFSARVLEMMIRVMRRELRAGVRIVYDEPAELLALYRRAGGDDVGREG